MMGKSLSRVLSLVVEGVSKRSLDSMEEKWLWRGWLFLFDEVCNAL